MSFNKKAIGNTSHIQEGRKVILSPRGQKYYVGGSKKGKPVVLCGMDYANYHIARSINRKSADESLNCFKSLVYSNVHLTPDSTHGPEGGVGET